MKRRLTVILLSLTLIFTLIPMAAFAADETVTITLKATTLDGIAPVGDYTLQIPKGWSLRQYFIENEGEFDTVVNHFKTDVYTAIELEERYADLVSGLEFRERYLVLLTETAGGGYDDTQAINMDVTLYVLMVKPINSINFNIETPVCGDTVEVTKVIDPDGTERQVFSKRPKIDIITKGVGIVTGGNNNEYAAAWIEYKEDIASSFLLNKEKPFEGTFKGGETYGYVAILELKHDESPQVFGSNIKTPVPGAKILSVDEELESQGYPKKGYVFIYGGIKAVHDWDSGKVTKEPTADATGVRTYTCKGCGKTKTESIPKLGSDPTQMGSDGTAVGAGASAAAAEQKITGMKTDTDPKGSKFNKLRLRSTKQTKTSITLKWKSNKKAEKYVIYGNRCGTSTKIRKSVKLYTVKKSTKTTMTKVIKKVKGAAVKKNTYYKFLVVALNKKNEVVSTSRMIHVATKGGKYTNYKKISVDKEKITKAKNLKKGKSLKLEAKQVKVTKSLKARKHVPIRYESTNKKIAKVTSKGVIKALKKGTCYVYIYAQNGVYKKMKVVVK